MEFVEVRRDGPVTFVTLSRPDVMNVINPAMHQELERAFTQFADNDSQ